jgi:3-oxoacyl-[acyl-carrier protein] reductase
MPGKLVGKAAVVTGASKGIGAQIAKELAAAGAAVAVNYSSDKAGAERVVAEISKRGGKAVAIGANLSKPEEVGRLFDEARQALGRLDILVNNAGVYEFAPLAEITPEHFHKQMNVNVLGLILACQQAVQRFGAEGASIVNISSAIVTLAPPNYAVYTATKAAVDAITVVLSKELAPRKVRVNAVNPGLIDTEGVRAAGIDDGDMRKWVESTAPAGRIGRVEDVAPAVAFVVSDDASYITGETLSIAGGLR